MLLYYAEPDAMARKHGAFATPEALCDAVFDVLPCVEIKVGDAAMAWRCANHLDAPARRSVAEGEELSGAPVRAHKPETVGDAAQTDAQAAKLEKRPGSCARSRRTKNSTRCCERPRRRLRKNTGSTTPRSPRARLCLIVGHVRHAKKNSARPRRSTTPTSPSGRG